MAKEIFDDFASALARGVGNAIMMFNPQAMILVGSVCRNSDLFADRMNKELAGRVIPGMLQETRIIVSDLYENAGPLGACACVLQHIFRSAHIAVESVV
jgi:predicted NBD/HSP70 family sugar kinase